VTTTASQKKGKGEGIVERMGHLNVKEATAANSEVDKEDDNEGKYQEDSLQSVTLQFEAVFCIIHYA